MSKSGPFVIINDNKKEQLMYQIALQNLKVNNPIHFFEDGSDALEYLETTKENPFLIICDINMPKMDGLELRRKIEANPYLKSKATPFVFMSSSPTSASVKEAYELSVQGFFKKSEGAAGIEKILALLIEYWTDCIDPNSFN
ncbi:MAG: response regulator [Bacteroidota bacterium]